MSKRAPSTTQLLVIAGFALSCFGILLFLWITFGGPTPFKARPYEINVPFKEATQLAQQSDGNRDARTLSDGIASAENSCRPEVIAFEYRGVREREQRVHEGVFILELPDLEEAFVQQHDRVIGVSIISRDGAQVARDVAYCQCADKSRDENHGRHVILSTGRPEVGLTSSPA